MRNTTSRCSLKPSKFYGMRMKPSDAVQDAFIGIARNMKTVSTIKEQKDLYYYVMRAAENAAHNRTRQTKHYTAAPYITKKMVSGKRSTTHFGLCPLPERHCPASWL